MTVKKQYLLLFGILLLFLLVATYRIDEIPGEWYGDISIVHEYVSEVLNGRWPFFFWLSAGPLYHYLIAPLIAVLGTNYLGYKLASATVGLIGLISIYFLAREITSVTHAIFTVLITSFSFWYLAWSRVGNFQIVVPVLTSAMIFLLLRYLRTFQVKYLIGGVVISSLGLFTYPATFILPGVFLSLLAYGLSSKDKKVKWKLRVLTLTGVGFIPALYLFLRVVASQPDNFTNGYIGSKVFTIGQLTTSEIIQRTIRNIYRTITMLHLEGDIVFRVNVPKSPQLDPVSGLMFIIGIILWTTKSYRKKFIYILIPLILLPLPSISPSLPPIEIPNSGRTIGMIPFVNLLIASGVWRLYLVLKNYNQKIGIIAVIFISVSISLLNLHKYFILYPNSLPNGNTPFGKLIANHIDTFPSDYQIYLTSCCWGEWGQPDPKGIHYVLKNKASRENIITHSLVTSCDQVSSEQPFLIIFNPNDQEKIQQFKACFPQGNFNVHSANNGQRVFASMMYR